MANVSIGTYGQYTPGNYGAHAIRVDIGPLTVWFSYQTPVAFQADGHTRRVRRNAWGSTTGKHLDALDGGTRSTRIPGERFERELAEVVARLSIEVPEIR